MSDLFPIDLSDMFRAINRTPSIRDIYAMQQFGRDTPPPPFPDWYNDWCEDSERISEAVTTIREFGGKVRRPQHRMSKTQREEYEAYIAAFHAWRDGETLVR